MGNRIGTYCVEIKIMAHSCKQLNDKLSKLSISGTGYGEIIMKKITLV